MNLAFVESPVQLLNVLEWAHARPYAPTSDSLASAAPATDALTSGAPATADPTAAGGAVPLTLVVLSPADPLSRGQLRRMAELARDEGHTVRWQEARGGTTAPLRAVRELTPLLRRAGRIVIGDPFSRYVHMLLTLAGDHQELTVVDDGTATLEFSGQLARGERLVRWHRRGTGGARERLLAPVSALARRRLAPAPGRPLEIFTAMPVEPTAHTTVTRNDFAWTRARFGPPTVLPGADLVGTSLVETGVVDPGRYADAVHRLARTHGARRYLAHRRESPDKLQRLARLTGLEIVRPELPLELVARRGPTAATVLSFPSTVVHTLPLALAGTSVQVAVCDIAPQWLRDGASPRAEGFLAGITGSARGVRRLPAPA
ncbi:hypothetical protein [Streptomyces yaizuensis]|uniref:DUF3597 domain-containing protein n=1 Tax=Streptomyces yaizuensis TaxID=2989713 RepID=A0ABQ5P557_9ACTN|nr:hypothetical protein [Streptomyces sp. YSPA8]GLF97726.1 DUF3597 domain-containing protein [Streptomyces sp. YSPA8]